MRHHQLSTLLQMANHARPALKSPLTHARRAFPTPLLFQNNQTTKITHRQNPLRPNSLPLSLIYDQLNAPADLGNFDEDHITSNQLNTIISLYGDKIKFNSTISHDTANKRKEIFQSMELAVSDAEFIRCMGYDTTLHNSLSYSNKR